jgi:hypothetical protein
MVPLLNVPEQPAPKKKNEDANEKELSEKSEFPQTYQRTVAELRTPTRPLLTELMRNDWPMESP